jgi:hypothetical protein
LEYADFPADYLLITGDFEHVASLPVAEGLSDMAYCLFDDADIPAMICGRFSVQTRQDVQTMIGRSMMQTRCSGTVVGIASDETSDLTDSADYEVMRNMVDRLTDKGFSVNRQLYQGTQSGADAAGNPTADDILGSLQDGACLVLYAGKGAYDGWNTGGFTAQHIYRMTVDTELPCVISASCLGGHFANRTCFAEQWMRCLKNEKPIGARAVIMPSNLADWDAVLSAMSVMVDRISFFDTETRIGELYRVMFEHIHTRMLRKKEAQCLILFGDPSLRLHPLPDNPSLEESGIKSSSFLHPLDGGRRFRVAVDGKLRIYNLQSALLIDRSVCRNDVVNCQQLASGIYIAVCITEDQHILTAKMRVE